MSSSKVLLLGDPGVGKTSLMVQYIHKKFSPLYIAGVGVGKYRWAFADDEPIDIIDHPGCKDDIDYGSQNVDIVVFIVDFTQESSFESVKTKWFKQAKTHYPNAQLILVGNKLDNFEDAIKVSKEEIKAFAEQIGASYFLTSAKASINVQQLFLRAHQLAQQAKAREVDDTMPEPEDSPPEDNPCLIALANYQQILAQLTEDAHFKKNKITEGIDKATHLGEELGKGLDLDAVNRILSQNTDNLLDNRNATGIKWYKVKSFFKGKRNKLMDNRYCESKTEELLVDLRENLMSSAI